MNVKAIGLGSIGLQLDLDFSTTGPRHPCLLVFRKSEKLTRTKLFQRTFPDGTAAANSTFIDLIWAYMAWFSF